ncbi:unnamed protein product [Mycena citricolor]|uniref:Uncharacterized protein n=1 Tax=Mycena citricolor TaxID=2018698 RepID=A0AAD2Q1X4_9AGAR|nr:unnamed protein product [Mycena citricolor]
MVPASLVELGYLDGAPGLNERINDVELHGIATFDAKEAGFDGVECRSQRVSYALFHKPSFYSSSHPTTVHLIPIP